MELSTLQGLTVQTLRDLYDAEMQELSIAAEIAGAVSSRELQKVLMTHTRETEGQLVRLEQVLRNLGEKPAGRPCRAMQALVQENREIMRSQGDPDVRDAGMILGQQKVEHYEIAAYGTAVTFCKLLGDEESARLLAQTLDEEEKHDKRLTNLAKKQVNPEASEAGGESIGE